MHDKITVENINVPGRTTNVNATKYLAMREVFLKVLPASARGMTRKELLQAISPRLLKTYFLAVRHPAGGPKLSSSIWRPGELWFGRIAGH